MKPKILYINHPESDYGGAFIYNGLCQVIGSENVFDYPIKYSYHGVSHEYSTPAIEHGHTAPLPWMENFTMPWTMDEEADGITLLESIRHKLHDGFFDFVVLESLRPIAMQSFDRLRRDIAEANIPIVVHEGEDFQHITQNYLDRIQPTLFLKREVSFSKNQECGFDMMCFPFSFPDSPAVSEFIDKKLRDVMGLGLALESVKGREHDVIFSCGNTWPQREEALRKLKDETKINSYLGVDGSLSIDGVDGLIGWWEYLRELLAAKMGISIRGYGYDTCRFWETAYVTLLVHDKLDLNMPTPYTHEQNCLEFTTTDELVALVKKWKDPSMHDDLVGMRIACMKHTLQYHTNSARVKTIFDRVGVEYEG